MVRAIGAILFGFLTCFLVLQLYGYWTANQHRSIDKLTEYYFFYFDRNKDQIIGIDDESTARIHKYNVNKQDFFDQADQDRDRRLTYDELKRFIERFDYDKSGIIEGAPAHWEVYFKSSLNNEMDSVHRKGG